MNVFIPAVAFLFGAVFGSFLNVCISRLPEGASVVSPPSRCPRCGHQIRWFENIPMLSWLALRAKCSGCGLRISPMYPLVELGVGLLWLWAFWHFGPTFAALRVAAFATIMTGIAVTDARSYLIPDGFTIFGLAWVGLSVLIALFIGEGNAPFASPLDALLGACAGAGAIGIAMWLGEWALGREAMGFGDLTLMAVVGAAVGPARSLETVFLGAALAVVSLPVVKMLGAYNLDTLEAGQLELPLRDRRSGFPFVPFGVFLAPAALITLVWGDALAAWYTGFVLQ